MALVEQGRFRDPRRVGLKDLIGESPGMILLREQITHLLHRQSPSRRLPTLLIQGETGTGKGLLAHAVHNASARFSQPFIDADCLAIPETLLEAELFGFERGAFTDAKQTKLGLFHAASGGSIFLDEVGLLPRTFQAKLLKVVEERGVRRLGSTHVDVVDLWVIAATNIDLATATRQGAFREDLYHRLAAMTLFMPPLRERGGDILLLAGHYLGRACAEYHLPLKVLTEEAQAALLAYAWPGNVRELANMLERVALLSGDESIITPDLLGLQPPAGPGKAVREPERSHLKVSVEGFEREVLAGADWSSFRPRVVVVEATVPKSDEPAYEDWEPMLFEVGYRFAMFDGLNRFYAHADEPALLQALAIPANVFDDFVPYAWAHQVDQAQQWAHSLEDALTQAQQERDQLYESVARACATARYALDQAAIADESVAVLREGRNAAQLLARLEAILIAASLSRDATNPGI